MKQPLAKLSIALLLVTPLSGLAEEPNIQTEGTVIYPVSYTHLTLPTTPYV